MKILFQMSKFPRKVLPPEKILIIQTILSQKHWEVTVIEATRGNKQSLLFVIHIAG